MSNNVKNFEVTYILRIIVECLEKWNQKAKYFLATEATIAIRFV